jgi:predicted component of type VI protein secretion system
MPPEEHYRLTIRQGATPGKIFDLAREVMIIGRDLKADIVINDPEVSRNHTRLTAQASGYLVEDMESTNGTFVNSQRLTGPKLVRPGDLVGLGENLVLEFGLSDAAAATIVMPQAAAQAQPQMPTPPAETYAPPPTPLPEAAAPPPAYEPYAPSQPEWSPAPPAPPVMPVGGEKKSNRNLIITIVVVALVLLCCCCLVIGGVIAWQQYNNGTLTLPGTGASQLLQLLL